jgi:hypothetical protein
MPARPRASRPQQSGAIAHHASIPTRFQAAKKTLRPRRSARRPVRYTRFFESFDDDAEEERADSEAGQSTDPEAEEDARIERSMGVIRKNAASRGSEGGTKYHCDV